MSAADPNEARLLHAKKLLNKFQTRQQQPSADSPLMADVEVVGAPPNEPLNGSQPPSVGVPSGGPSLRSSRSSSFVNVDMGHEPQFLNGGTPTNSSVEVESLRTTLAEKEHHLGVVMGKLQALHGHYVELHKAYAELKQTAAANSANAEFSQQISQLQTALAIAVDEKTQLQAQLRSSNAHSKSLEAELELRARSSAAHSNDHQTAQLQAEIQKLSEKIAAQAATIAQQRKECADVEAKIVLVNQDKNDVQARLKYVYHEKDELNARLQELKNELNIKEIYIRQLSKHSAADSTSGQQTIQTLTEQKNFFEQELKQRTDELTQLRGEFNASKQHYESCLLQARTHSSSLEHALEAANQQKREVEFSKHCLEEELQLLRRAAEERLAASEQPPAAESDSTTTAIAMSSEAEPTRMEYNAMKNSLERMEHEFHRQTAFIGQLNQVIEEKESTIAQLQHEATEAEHQIQRLNEQIRHSRSMDADVGQLSVQLQNERATVSRAVAQNLELKEQLGELQDQLVAMTNRCAQVEDEKSNALAAVNRLTRQLGELTTNSEQRSEPRSEQSDRQSSTYRPPADLISTFSQSSESHEPPARNQLQFLNVSNVHYPSEEAYEEQRQANATAEEHELREASAALLQHQQEQREAAGHSHEHPHEHPVEDPVVHEQQADLPLHHQAESTVSSSAENSDEERAEDEEEELNSSSATTPADELHRHGLEAIEAEIQDFLSTPKPSDTDFMQALRHTFYRLQDNEVELRGRLEHLERLSAELRQANHRLEHSLTAVESENESIADFIELYRQQRAQVRAKVAEKEEECATLRRDRDKLKEQVERIRRALLNSLQSVHEQPAEQRAEQSGEVEGEGAAADRQPDSGVEVAEEAAESTCKLHELVHLLQEMSDGTAGDQRVDQLAQSLHQSPALFNPEVHCRECRGRMHNL
ncbi:hypothetical protein M3Y99_00256600 [Aphelenchoides fujianensis]|nr:hypothetical protein M3Y99_00256600 [Aphelenchoides fujianensis]